MRQIRSDLWETRAEGAAPGPTTHAYLWTPPSGENVLFYSVASDADFDRIDELGGITRQYLSHQDEAGPPLQLIRERFGARLYAPAAEAEAIGRFASIDEQLSERHVDDNGVEVVPTPGHTPGSTSYLVPGAGGERYLFTGDTLIVSPRGNWRAGYLPGYSDAPALADSLALLATLEPDLIISSAFMGDSGVHGPGDGPWAASVQEAIDRLPRP
jgi:hydroxyacylglutathione hydrolase